MEWVEITGRTVKEATDLALDELGVDEADAEIQVLEEPRAGLFGRTRGTARVKARVVPRQHRPKQERRDRKRSGGGGAKGGGRSRGGGDRPAASSSSSDASSEAAPARNGDGGARQGGGGGRRRRSSSGGGDSAPRRTAGAASDQSTDGPRGPQQGEPVDTSTLSLDEHVATVERFVAGLVDAFGLEGDVQVVEIDDETREVRVIGDDLGLLIGPRGLTLQAVHELARTVVYRNAPDGQEGRVRIDIGGYRERRREALERFAAKVAEDVRESGTAKALEPMSPPDRKVVHDAINAIDGVRTSSEGEEPRRRVVVHPED